jgi:hypothetical protein
MHNISVTVSEDVYCQARVWAAQGNTSISAVVQQLLARLPRLPIAALGFLWAIQTRQAGNAPTTIPFSPVKLLDPL